MGTSNSGRLASSSGIFLGLDPGKDRCGKRGKDAGVTAFASQQVPCPIRDCYQGKRDGIKRTYSLMPVR